MKITYIAALVLTMTTGAAAANSLNRPVGEHVNHRDKTVGSFVQWTDEIAVTAGQAIDSPLYESPCLDIQFFKHKGTPVSWAEAGIGESVIAVGKTVKKPEQYGATILPLVRGAVTTTEIPGKITARVGTDAECSIEYQVMNGRMQGGMAGGPVYSDVNGAAVGILKGNVDYQGTTGALIVPYAAIAQAWQAVQGKHVSND